MTDLVKRLRDGGETCGIDACRVRDAKSGCLCAIAADRIEALEKALDILQAAMVAKKPIPMPFKIAMNKASAALAGEKQD